MAFNFSTESINWFLFGGFRVEQSDKVKHLSCMDDHHAYSSDNWENCGKCLSAKSVCTLFICRCHGYLYIWNDLKSNNKTLIRSFCLYDDSLIIALFLNNSFISNLSINQRLSLMCVAVAFVRSSRHCVYYWPDLQAEINLISLCASLIDLKGDKCCIDFPWDIKEYSIFNAENSRWNRRGSFLEISVWSLIRVFGREFFRY